MAFKEYQKKELGIGLNPFNRPVEYTGPKAWTRLLTQILFTRPGTYPTDPELGVGIQDYRYTFFNEVKGEIEAKINNQIQRYLPDIPIGTVSVEEEEINGKHILVLQFEMQVSENDLKTAYVAVDTGTQTLNYEIAF